MCLTLYRVLHLIGRRGNLWRSISGESLTGLILYESEGILSFTYIETVHLTECYHRYQRSACREYIDCILPVVSYLLINTYYILPSSGVCILRLLDVLLVVVRFHCT
jgi:hypothetical protein